MVDSGLKKAGYEYLVIDGVLTGCMVVFLLDLRQLHALVIVLFQR